MVPISDGMANGSTNRKREAWCPSEKRIKKATMRAKSAIASERAKPKMA